MKHRATSQINCRRILLLLLLTIIWSAGIHLAPAISSEVRSFLIDPYVQLGNGGDHSLAVEWVSKAAGNKYKLKYKLAGEHSKEISAHIHEQKENISGQGDLYFYSASLVNLRSGERYEYQISSDNAELFHSYVTAPKACDQPLKFAVVGDFGANTAWEKQICCRMFNEKPELVVMTGDIVYTHGLFSEYLQNYFPIYNADKSDLTQGAPLLRSVVTAAAVGNHDIDAEAIDSGNLSRNKDAFAYFHLWSEPLNGPNPAKDGVNTVHLSGFDWDKKAFIDSCKTVFPRMANFSFDDGPAHFVVLDANYYMDWTQPAIRKWLEDDLTAHKDKPWKFVLFHQPPFTRGRSHYKEQRMRVCCEIFERLGVDIVFAGHTHDYERTYPLSFKPNDPNGIGKVEGDGTVHGVYALDRAFDGKTMTASRYPIYIVSGGGGAYLHTGTKAELMPDDVDCQAVIVNNTHSFTAVEITNDKLHLQQIGDQGQLLDEISVTKKK